MKKIGLMIGVILIISIVGLGVYFISMEKDQHEHIFTEATCTVPKTCTICGIVEGTTLLHTTDIGKCTLCEQLQNEELVLEIGNNVTMLGENITNCSAEIQSANLNSTRDCFNKFYSASIKLKENKKYCESIIQLCGEYEELSSVKENCNEILNINLDITSSDIDSLTGFLMEYKSYLLTAQSLYEEMTRISELYI